MDKIKEKIMKKDIEALLYTTMSCYRNGLKQKVVLLLRGIAFYGFSYSKSQNINICLDSWERPVSWLLFQSIIIIFFLLIVVVINLLLCPIYKLNFLIDMSVQEKTAYIGFGTMHGFRPPFGVLGYSPWR